jgi:hypothetical protein
VKKLTQRPSALLAVCTPVSELLPSTAAVPTAHETVGYGGVATGAVTGTTLLAPQRTQVKGINGFAAKRSVMGNDPVDGVRGKPPRGRPV